MWSATYNAPDAPDTRSATTRAEDECRELYASLSPFKRATLHWLGRCEGMDDERALRLRRGGEA